jgi:ABC-type Mn2+/Zn2+ transport system permease subunit
LWSHRLPIITVLAVAFAIGSGLAGLWISGRWNVAAGASISLTATAVLLVSWLCVRLRALPARLPAAVAGRADVVRT